MSNKVVITEKKWRSINRKLEIAEFEAWFWRNRCESLMDQQGRSSSWQWQSADAPAPIDLVDDQVNYDVTLEEERINEQLREPREFNASFSTSDGNSQATEATGRPTPTKERGTISPDTEALLRQTEAQRSAEKAQQRLAELERATREAQRSGS